MNTDFRSVNASYDQDAINGISEDEYMALFGFLGEQETIASVLDLAGGSGKLASMLLDTYDDVTLFDIADNMIKQAILAGFPETKAIVGDFMTYDFKREFDAVILKSAMHEISRSEMDKFHKKLAGIVENNGWFIDWDVHQKQDGDAQWFAEWVRLKDSMAGLDDLVKNRGFYTEVEIKDSLLLNGFKNIQTIHKFYYTLSARKFEDMYWKRKPEKTIEFIRMTRDLLKSKPDNIILQVADENDIILKVPAVIMVAQKV